MSSIRPYPGYLRDEIGERLCVEYGKGLEHGARDALDHAEQALDRGEDMREWIARVRVNVEAAQSKSTEWRVAYAGRLFVVEPFGSREDAEEWIAKSKHLPADAGGADPRGIDVEGRCVT